jgi:hypothetical protein
VLLGGGLRGRQQTSEVGLKAAAGQKWRKEREKKKVSFYFQKIFS